MLGKFRTNSLSRLFSKELDQKGTAMLYSGVLTSLAFAVFKLVTSIIYSSFWLGAVAVYYFILSFMRLQLIFTVRQENKLTCDDDKLRHEYSGCRFCGCLMLALDLGMAGMVYQMIWQNKGYSYPGYVIYLTAAYTFYTFIIAIINVFKFRKVKRPVLSAGMTINLCAAMMSLLALQTAMIEQFDSGDHSFRFIMNLGIGTAVCLITFVLAVYMIVRSSPKKV